MERAENLELVDVIATFKLNIARRAELQRERDRLRTELRRRYRQHHLAQGRQGERGTRRPTLYLVEGTQDDE
jgi:hypothetical protein